MEVDEVTVATGIQEVGRTGRRRHRERRDGRGGVKSDARTLRPGRSDSPENQIYEQRNFGYVQKCDYFD